MRIRVNTKMVCTDGDAAPEWILLFKEGEVTFDDLDPVIIDETAFNLIKAEFKRRGNDMVVDYEHQTLEDVEAPAAGWIKELAYKKGRGIYARVDWTARANKYILNREYRYFSPVFYARDTDSRVYKLDNVALTNAPRTNNLTPIVAGRYLNVKDPEHIVLQEKTPAKEENDMELLNKLIELLGLGAEATEADVLAAISAAINKADEPAAAGEGADDPGTTAAVDVIDQVEAQLTDVVEALEGLKDEVLDEPVQAKALLKALDLKPGATYRSVVASVHALKQGARNGDLERRLAKMEAERKADNAARVVAKALSAGKITPDQKAWAEEYAKVDPKGFDLFVAKAPQVVPVDRLPAYTAKTNSAGGFDKNIAAMFGVTEDDYKKYGAK